MSSQRLPGKMIQPIGQMPLFAYVLRRCRHIAGLDGLILATSTESSDDPLARAADKTGWPVFRGSLDNVLARTIACAESQRADVVVRVCGDSPFVDVALAARMIAHLVDEGLDYVAVDKVRCVYGLDSEIVTLQALKRCLALGLLPDDREHVTHYIRRCPQAFATALLAEDLDPFGQRYRLTVDTAADMDFCRGIAEDLSDRFPALDFPTAAVFDAIARQAVAMESV